MTLSDRHRALIAAYYERNGLADEELVERFVREAVRRELDELESVQPIERFIVQSYRRSARKPPTTELARPVGVMDIAEFLGLTVDAVRRWIKDGTFVPPRWRVSRLPAWDLNKDVIPWAQATGRMDF